MVRENRLAAFQICWCRAAKHDQCPLNILSSSLHPAKAWCLIHILMSSVAFSLLCTHKTHTGTHTCAELALPHSEQQGARLFLAAASSSSCIWAGAQLHRGTRGSRGRLSLPPHPPRSHPDFHSKGTSGPRALSRAHPFFDRNGSLPTKTTYPTSLQFLNSDFSKPHSFSTKLTPNCCW